MKKNFLVFLTVSLFLVSCESCKTDEPQSVVYTHGAFVVNEGSFGNLNGSITWLNNSTVVSNPFADVNAIPLGDVVTDFDVFNGKTYAVANSTTKIVVSNLETFELQTQITGFSYPRCFQVINDNLAAVTDGSFEGKVYWINLLSNTISGSTPVGFGPEGMAVANNKLYVCNSGGWNSDNTISVIDLVSQNVVETISVGDRPVEIKADNNGYLWVLCSGETQYNADFSQIIGHTSAALCRINTADNAVVTFGIGALGDHPLHCDLDELNHKLYISNLSLLSFDTQSLDLTDFLATPSQGVSVNPVTQEVWVCAQSNYATPSNVKVYSSAGVFVKEITAGIAAWKVVFN